MDTTLSPTRRLVARHSMRLFPRLHSGRAAALRLNSRVRGSDGPFKFGEVLRDGIGHAFRFFEILSRFSPARRAAPGDSSRHHPSWLSRFSRARVAAPIMKALAQGFAARASHAPA